MTDNYGTWFVEWFARHATALAVGNGYDAENTNDPNWHNDSQTRNAVAHAYGSADVTIHRGRNFAEWAENKKEQYDGSSPADEYKDRYNNEVGRRVAEWMAANGYNVLNYSESELQQIMDDLIIDALNEGHLIVDATPQEIDGDGIDPRITNEDEPTWTAPSENWENIAAERDYDHAVPGTESEVFLPGEWTGSVPEPTEDSQDEEQELPRIPDHLTGLPSWIADPIILFGLAPAQGSPLVLDLDGDGVELTTFNAASTTTFFDLDGDGFATQTAWVGDDDGLLVRDLNENGIIDDGTELFGSPTIDGFAQLAELDSNGDLVIDANDADWADLRIWQDVNSDAVTQEGELLTLASLDIESISLAGVTASTSTISGNAISHTSTFKYENGSTAAIVDAWFVHDKVNNYYTGDYDLNPYVLFLPTLRGFGQLPDLHIAMSQNEDLLDLVEEFTLGWGFDRFADPATLDSDIATILYEWAGVSGVNPNSRGGVVDAQHLEFLEEYFG